MHNLSVFFFLWKSFTTAKLSFLTRKKAKWMRNFANESCKRFFLVFCRVAASSIAGWMDCPTFIKSNEQKPFYCHFNSIARRFFLTRKKFFVRQFQLVIATDRKREKVIKSRWNPFFVRQFSWIENFIIKLFDRIRFFTSFLCVCYKAV